ncbi:Wzz/FepE/Etk N-terminal domain-containing protein [Staphylococcus sp. EZ-P03]|uniref:YveK family protein n=1 Tax=Staphylococcus sp. EZ-P03 TaxID=2282739 RepID=UPI000DF846B1|nr:Wzz/FepE/Etk N-terminal domain-containing protein [Staphylococcus sp. EZ-P03]
MNKNLDLKGLIQIIKSNLIMILSAMVLFGFISFLITQFLITPQYTATSQVIIKQSKNDRGNLYSNPTEVQTNIQLIKTYSQLIGSDEVKDSAVQLLKKQGITVENSDIAVKSEENSQLIKIIVKNESPRNAVKLANALAETSKGKIKQVMGVDNLFVLSKAKYEQVVQPTSPNVLFNTVLGIVFGLFLSMIVIFSRKMLDNKIDNEAKVEALLHLPVVGKISDVGGKKR